MCKIFEKIHVGCFPWRVLYILYNVLTLDVPFLGKPSWYKAIQAFTQAVYIQVPVHVALMANLTDVTKGVSVVLYGKGILLWRGVFGPDGFCTSLL